MNTVKFIGMDVHKNSITIAIADQGHRHAARIYGIKQPPQQLDAGNICIEDGLPLCFGGIEVAGHIPLLHATQVTKERLPNAAGIVGIELVHILGDGHDLLFRRIRAEAALEQVFLHGDRLIGEIRPSEIPDADTSE